MANVFQAGQLNVASLTNDDVYVQIVQPANTQVQGIQTGVAGFVGSASWGPLNTPVRLGSMSDAIRNFGPAKVAANDMATDLWLAFSLLVPVCVAIRVSDGTDTAAGAVLAQASTGTVTIGGAAHTGDVVTVTLNGLAVAYTTLASDTTTALIAASVANALNASFGWAALATATVIGSVITITSKTNNNTMTLTTGVTGAGATVTSTASGGTLTGGSAFATGTVTLGGAYHAADVVNITLAGVLLTYAATAGDATLAGVAASTAAAINASTTFPGTATVAGAVITITSKTSVLAPTLVSTVTGGGATITATASGGTLTGGIAFLGAFNALYTGVRGASIVPTFVPGSNSTPAAPTWTLNLAMGGSVPVTEQFTNLPQTGFAAALVAALANGQGPSRGPSVLARFTAATGTGAPTQTAAVFTGGTNGDANVTTAQQLGTNQAIPATGMFAFKDTGVQVFGLSGNTDSTAFATIRDFAQSIGAYAQVSFAPNTTTVAAIAAKKALGIDNPYIKVLKDWVQFLDTTNSVLRLVPPTAFAVSRIATLTPEQSSGNKPIGLIIATERTLPPNAMPYSSDEAGQLAANGISFITNPCPGGAYFGLRNGLNSSSNPLANGDEYTRVVNFLAYSLAGSLGAFVDRVQTAVAGDPTRAEAETTLNTFMQGVEGNGYVADQSVDMSFGDNAINSKASVINGFMNAVVRAQIKSIVRFFVVTLVAGKGVDVTVR